MGVLVLERLKYVKAIALPSAGSNIHCHVQIRFTRGEEHPLPDGLLTGRAQIFNEILVNGLETRFASSL